MAAKLVFVKVNGWEDTAMAKEMSVRGYPTLILMKADGTEIDRVAGYLPAPDFIKTFTDFAAGIGTLEDLLAKHDQHPDSVGIIVQLGEKYASRSSDSLAGEYFHSALEKDPGNKSGQTDNALHSLGQMAYGRGKEHYDTAAARFTALSERYPTSELAEDAQTWVPYIYALQEKNAEALALFEKFLIDHPQSTEAGWVQEQIDKIKKKGT
jgi:tetratricopeptide (TPR) repeat protein